MAATLIYPHQLLEKHPCLNQDRPCILVEDDIFFHELAFHKQKLIFHYATMQNYRDYLEENGYKVFYFSSSELAAELKRKKIIELHLCDPIDERLEQKLRIFAKKNQIALHISQSPLFLSSPDEFQPKMANFYIDQRKKHYILTDKQGKPIGGKWSFDVENREKLPSKVKVPLPQFPKPTKAVEDAIYHVETHFAENPGNATPFHYPTTFEQAHNWLDDFLAHRLQFFGPYEDAITEEHSYLFHSVLSPLLNVGLLTPREVINKALAFAEQNKIPLASIEGFVRQIIGWREYMRGAYEAYSHEARTKNFWKNKRSLPASFWSASTGIEPLDNTIRKVLKTGYCHHIERLMVLGCFMLLCEIDPDEVYTWFMELFIDAYDWIMVPNVYCVSQNADGGLITTKPYLCSSSYILKMSNYQKGPWCEIWDGLYWRFIHKHIIILGKNPRWAMMVATLKAMPPTTLKQHLAIAENFLNNL